LVAVEHDEAGARRLLERYRDTNVEVIHGDATELTFGDESFDSAASLTMLHHVPTVALQNQLLRQLWRVLRFGGVLIGSDSLPSDGLHRFHENDVYNPLEPGTMYSRLQTIGFDRITIRVDGSLMFVAHKSQPDADVD